MQSLLKNIRFYVLLLSVFISIVVYVCVTSTVADKQLQIIRIEQYYALISLVYLYLTLLAGPFCYSFSWFPFQKSYFHSRRALGVATFYFAFLHVVIAFFGQLGGFHGLAFLSTSFFTAVMLGIIALGIFFLLTVTSLDYAVEKMSFRSWKFLHRFVYVAALFILIHTLLLGTHYITLTDPIPQITFIAIALLLLLEAPRIDTWINKFFPLPRFGLTTILVISGLGMIYLYFFSPFITNSTGAVSFDIHAGHKALAQLAAQQNNNQQFAVDVSKIPGFDGDRNKRYTVGMTTDPQNPLPNQNVTIHFTVYDASNGNLVTYFKYIYAKKIHMIVVNSSLTYFSHIHPDQDAQGFVITTQFPTADIYHMYIEFQPYGGIEQQMAFTLPVGGVTQSQTATQSADPNITTKIFGKYAVTMNTNGNLSAADMSFGNQKITFTVRDAKTKAPITTIKPYLASFGHLTMINEKTYDFIHVHPYSLIVPPPDANGGPTVDFLPIGIYGPFQPGIYRVFAEFNPDNNLFTSDFTVDVH